MTLAFSQNNGKITITSDVIQRFGFPKPAVPSFEYVRSINVVCEFSSGAISPVPVIIEMLPDTFEHRWRGLQNEPIFLSKFMVTVYGSTADVRVRHDELEDLPNVLSLLVPSMRVARRSRKNFIAAFSAAFEAARPHFMVLHHACLPIMPVAFPIRFRGKEYYMHVHVDTDFSVNKRADGSVSVSFCGVFFENDGEDFLCANLWSRPTGADCLLFLPDDEYIQSAVGSCVGVPPGTVTSVEVMDVRNQIESRKMAFKLQFDEVCKLMSSPSDIGPHRVAVLNDGAGSRALGDERPPPGGGRNLTDSFPAMNLKR